MDPALLKERELFLKRQSQSHITSNKNKSKDDFVSKPAKKAKTTTNKKATPNIDISSQYESKKTSSSSLYKFGILAKIVKYMKSRHMEGDTHPLTIDEILDETNQLDVSGSHRYWLLSEALPNNPKLEAADGGFCFKPKYNVRDKKNLFRLLEKHDKKGYGGILVEDIEESVPRANKALKALDEQIIYITRSGDKKRVMFYNDKSYDLKIDEDLVKLWRSVGVESLDENRIEDYLQRQGIASMQDISAKKVIVRKNKKNRRKGTFKSNNEHLTGILENYNA